MGNKTLDEERKELKTRACITFQERVNKAITNYEKAHPSESSQLDLALWFIVKHFVPLFLLSREKRMTLFGGRPAAQDQIGKLKTLKALIHIDYHLPKSPPQ